jgi:hypothetical protein
MLEVHRLGQVACARDDHRGDALAALYQGAIRAAVDLRVT